MRKLVRWGLLVRQGINIGGRETMKMNKVVNIEH